MPESTEIWYLALRKLHIKQGEGVIPSSLRISRGQRFTLDGDEAIDLEGMLRVGAVKLYEDSDRDWADVEMANAPKPRRRRRTVSGKNNG